jgi:hypothetical protein
MTHRRPPEPGFQLRFLKELQRILQEGRFTATYKFALVHALADLSVEMGEDTGDELDLPVIAIARRFTELYWRQVAPWPGREQTDVLAQNRGRQATVVRVVKEARVTYGDRIDRLRAEADAWDDLTNRVRNTVREMPLLKLQTVGEESREFLYENRIEGRGDRATITLEPGIAYCFRRFHPLVVELAQGGWARFVRRENAELIGQRTDLREFLFGAPRANLEAVRKPLVELQNGGCFYCGRALGSAVEVDHFVPWSRYPVDLGHNFVAVHDHCNRAKADHLSAEEHLARWVEWQEDRGYDLDQAFAHAGIPHDRQASLRITRWAYTQVEERQGLVWVKGRTLEPLSDEWRRLLAEAA